MPTREALQLMERYNRAVQGLENSTVDRLHKAMDAAYRDLEKELRRTYPDIASNQTLLATQRKVLLLEQLGETLQVVRPDAAQFYQQTLQETLQTANQTGRTMADELISAVNPSTGVAALSDIPIEAVALQARDGLERLRRHSEEFRGKASAIVEQGLIQGWGPAKVADLLRSELQTTKSKAETIARTEILSALNDAAQQRYADNGIEGVQWICTIGDVCKYCVGRNTQVYPTGKVRVPAHPRCRCVLLPWRPSWADKGLTDEFIKDYEDKRLKDLEKLGQKPSKGITPFEKAAGLTEPPKPLWTIAGGLDRTLLPAPPPPPTLLPQPTPAPAPKRTRKTQPAGDFPAKLDGLEEVRSLGGSTGAKLVRDPKTGKQFVMKLGNTPAHLEEEMAADAAYRALGVPVPNYKRYVGADGKPVKLAEYIEGRSLKEAINTATEAEKAIILKNLQKNFAADALLGNWDVVGMEFDNVLVDKAGQVWRIDNGGALRFRAQGGAKNALWNNYPTELFTLRDATVNAQTAKVFGQGNLGVKWMQVVDQIDDLAKKEKALLKALPKELHGNIKGRLAEMKHLSQVSRTLAADQWKDEYISDFAKHSLGIRKAGIVDRLPSQLVQRYEGAYQVIDENGKLYDSFRGQGSIIADLEKYVSSVGGKHSIVGDYADSQGGDSWRYSQTKAMKYFYANQREVPLDRYFWRYGLDTSKSAYKDMIQQHGEKAYRETFAAWHAFNHEMLTKTAFSRKNKDGTITLIRTESKDVLQGMNGFKPGDRDVKIARGFAESTSVYNQVNVFGGEVTVQNVPKHRVFGTYWTEKYAEAGGSGFLGDGENEFVAMMEDIPFDYLKNSKDLAKAIARKQKQSGGAVTVAQTTPVSPPDDDDDDDGLSSLFDMLDDDD